MVAGMQLDPQFPSKVLSSLQPFVKQRLQKRPSGHAYSSVFPESWMALVFLGNQRQTNQCGSPLHLYVENKEALQIIPCSFN